jgi:hypothetical protein
LPAARERPNPTFFSMVDQGSSAARWKTKLTRMAVPSP